MTEEGRGRGRFEPFTSPSASMAKLQAIIWEHCLLNYSIGYFAFCSERSGVISLVKSLPVRSSHKHIECDCTYLSKRSLSVVMAKIDMDSDQWTIVACGPAMFATAGEGITAIYVWQITGDRTRLLHRFFQSFLFREISYFWNASESQM